MSSTEITKRLGASGLTHVQLAITDIDGMLRGKYLALDALQNALDHGTSMCDCLLGWDIDDQLYEHNGYTGWDSGYPDVPLRIDPTAERVIPIAGSEDTDVLFLCEFDGEASALCPRALLKRLIARADELGFAVRCGFEYEFSVFDESSSSVHAKDFRSLDHVTQGNFGYSVLRLASYAQIHRALIKWCQTLGIPLAGLHTENGPGIWEAAIASDNALEAADRATLFKTFTKIFYQQYNLIPTFMAKWSETYQGQGGHIHISLTDKDTGQPVFYDTDATDGMSALFRHFIAGQQTLMPELLVLAAPNINSYRRLSPGTWAPTSASWGIDNRTCALRVVGTGPSSKRVEYRVGGADANPYLALAAALAAGLHGIEQKLEPSHPTEGNAYAADNDPGQQLPRTLSEATARFRCSPAASSLFGEEFVHHYADSRQWEVDQFNRSVTDWEVKRYFETV